MTYSSKSILLTMPVSLSLIASLTSSLGVSSFILLSEKVVSFLKLPIATNDKTTTAKNSILFFH